jgi:hypothetical protein
MLAHALLMTEWRDRKVYEKLRGENSETVNDMSDMNNDETTHRTWQFNAYSDSICYTPSSMTQWGKPVKGCDKLYTDA